MESINKFLSIEDQIDNVENRDVKFIEEGSRDKIILYLEDYNNEHLINELSSMPWGIILFAIGFFMILPILRYIKTLIKFLINQ